MLKMDFGDFLQGIASVFTGLSIGNPFDTNADAVFTLGVFFLYFCK